MDYSDRERFPDNLVYRVANLFIQEGIGETQEVADKANEEFPHAQITRQKIYPILRQAVARKFVRFFPPPKTQLCQQLAAKFPNVLAERVRVVDTFDARENDEVAAVAAELAHELLIALSHLRPNRPVGVGLGPGRATLDFCRHLSDLLNGDPQPPKFSLTAISAGGPPYSPQYASTSFFNLFSSRLLPPHRGTPGDQHRQIGLFAESLVPAKDLDRIKKRSGVKEAFESRKDIDLVVTAMGDIDDEHDLLCWFLKDSGVDLSKLRNAGWVGNVQYRPYSTKGPIQEKPDDLRAVTLFELKDLVELANQADKYVVLIARPCGICGRTREKALLPLLTNPQLKVFNRLVMDSGTATRLLQG